MADTEFVATARALGPFLVLHPSQADQIDRSAPGFTPVERYPRTVKKDPDEIGTLDGYRILVPSRVRSCA